jgi:hypothetical protein
MCLRYAARPWYKPEPSSIVGYYTEKLLVKLGWYEEMPGPRCVATTLMGLIRFFLTLFDDT